MRLSILVSLLAVAESSGAAAAGPRILPIGEATHTREVRAIATLGDRVLSATSGGVAVHERKSGAHLFTLTSRHGLGGNAATALAVLPDGSVLVGREFGASVLNGVDGARRASDIHLTSVDTGARADFFDPTVAIRTRNGEVFVVGQRSGPRRFDPVRRILEPGRSDPVAYSDAVPTYHGWLMTGVTGRIEHRVESRLQHQLDLREPIVAAADDEPHVLLATGERLLQLSHGRVHELRLRDRSGPIPAVAFSPTHGREILVASRDGAVYSSLDGVLTPLTQVDGTLSAIHSDGSVLWLGIAKHGLARVDLDARQVLTSLSPAGEICSNHITHLTQHRGQLVAGSFDRGVCAERDGVWRALPTPSPFVHGLASDGHHLYVATSNGIVRFGPKLNPAPFTRRDSRVMRWLKDTAATGATAIAPGVVALSSAYGVVTITRDRRGRARTRFYDRSQGTIPFKITALSSAGRDVFVASETEGVTRMGLSDRGPRRYRDPTELPEAWVTAVAAPSLEQLWVGTCQNGVSFVDDNDVRFVNTQRGLPDDRVTAIAADDNGAFVGTLWGLAHVSNAGVVTRYPVQATAPDPRSSTLFREGSTLWYGTESGLVEFRIDARSGHIEVAESMGLNDTHD